MGGRRSVFDVLRKGFLTFFRMLFKALMLNIFGCVLVRSDVFCFDVVGCVVAGCVVAGCVVAGCVVAGCVASLNAPYVG
jgi:hypothetical protein